MFHQRRSLQRSAEESAVKIRLQLPGLEEFHLRRRRFRGPCLNPFHRLHSLSNCAFIFDDFSQKVVAGLIDDYLFARRQRQHGMWHKLYGLNELTIDDDLVPINFLNQNHTATVLTGLSSPTSIKFLRLKSIVLNDP